jgi:hypothetical protein
MSEDDRAFKIIELKKQLKQQEEIGCDIQGKRPALTADDTDYYLPFPGQKAFHLFLRRMEELLESAEYQQKVWRGQRKLSRYWTTTGHPAIDYFQKSLGVTFKVIEKEPGYDRIQHFSQGPFLHLADHPGRPDQDDIDDITDDDVIGFDSRKELDLFLNYAGTIIDAAIRQESSRIPLRYNILSRNKKNP